MFSPPGRNCSRARRRSLRARSTKARGSSLIPSMIATPWVSREDRTRHLARMVPRLLRTTHSSPTAARFRNDLSRSAVESSARELIPGFHSTSTSNRRLTCSSARIASGILVERSWCGRSLESMHLTWICNASSPRVATRSHVRPRGVGTSLKTSNPRALSLLANRTSRRSEV